MFDVGSNGGDENNTVYPQDKIVVGAKKEKNAMLISWNKSPISHFVGSGQSNIKSIVLNKSNGDAFRFSLSLFIWLFKKIIQGRKVPLGEVRKACKTKFYCHHRVVAGERDGRQHGIRGRSFMGLKIKIKRSWLKY